MGMASWGSLLLAAAVATLSIGVPGALIGIALHMRGLWLAATTPLLGIGVIAITAMWTYPAGIRWNWWTVLATALIVASIGLLVTRATGIYRRPNSLMRSWRWAPLIGAGLGCTLLVFRLLPAIGAPDWFDQAGDNVFHLNAVRWILDQGIASPFAVVRGLDPTSSASFYPTAWHAIVALVSEVSDAGIPVSSNAVLIVVACMVWPMGGVLLTRVLFGGRTALLIAAGAISAGFATFPLLLIPYMGTYPLVLAIAMVPGALAIGAALVSTGRDLISPWVAAMAALVVAIGIGLAHPSALIMSGALMIPLVWCALWKFSAAHPERRGLAIALAALYLITVFALIVLVRPNFDQPNSARSSTGQAIGEILTGAFAGQPIPVALSALSVLGVVAALRGRSALEWSAVGMWVLGSLIYMAAASENEFIRLLVAGPWYSDATRVAAFTPIVILPLAARGADWFWIWASRHIDFTRHPGRERVAEITAIALLGLLMVQSTAARGATEFMRAMFTPTDNVLTSPIPVSSDDRELLVRLPSLVPANAVVAGDPWTGASFVYALTGRRVLVPHMLAPVTGQTKELFDGIATSGADGPACQAARNLHVHWILELRGGKTLPNRPHYPGLQGLGHSPNVELADRVGDSSLYKIIGCNLG